jgi:hypothetical protein
VRAPGPELLSKSGLADPRLPGQQHQPGGSAPGGLPRGSQLGAFRGPANERCAAEPVAAGTPRFVAGQQGVVRGTGRGRRFHTELPFQRRRAFVVHPQRPGAIAARVMQPYQSAVRLLAQRFFAQQPLGVSDRAGQIALRLKTGDQPIQRVQVAPAQPVPLPLDPLVLVAAGQQIAGVRVDCLLQGHRAARCSIIGASQRLLEGRHVQPVRSLGPPLQRTRRDVQEPVHVGQPPAQVVQHVPKVGARLCLGGVRPEEEGDPLTWLRRVPMEQEVGQQGLGARRLQLRRDLSAAQRELAEQADDQRIVPHTGTVGAASARHYRIRANVPTTSSLSRWSRDSASDGPEIGSRPWR